MRILYLTHYFPPEGNAPASRVHEMSKRWAREGHEVTVITCAPNAPAGGLYPGYRNRLVQRERVDGIDVVRVWTYLAANKGTVLRIANYLSFMLTGSIAGLLVRRPDVVIATSPQFFCGWAGVLVRWFRRLPFILEIRDIWPESVTAVGAMQNRRLVTLLETLETRMYAAATHIVTVGEGYKAKLVERGVRPEQISVVTNGVDTDVYYPREADADLVARHRLTGRFVCAYVGTIGMACGLDVVLRAGRMLKAKGRDDIRFLLVGDGASREQLAEQVRLEGLDNVLLVGRQPKEKVPSYLSIANACLVHLKKRDLFATVLPSKIFEAAAMGKPIVLGVVGHAAEVVRRAGAGICIEPENEGELVEAVERLADDRALGHSLGEAGRQHVLRYYNRDTLAQEYLEVIHRVCGLGETPVPAVSGKRE